MSEEKKLEPVQVRKFSVPELTPLNKFGTVAFEEGKTFRLQGYVGWFSPADMVEKTSKKGHKYFNLMFAFQYLNYPEQGTFCTMTLWESERWFFDRIQHGEFKMGDFIEIECTYSPHSFQFNGDHFEVKALYHDPNRKRKPREDNSSENGRFEINLKSKMSHESVAELQFLVMPKMAEDGYSGGIVSDIDQVRFAWDFHRFAGAFKHFKDVLGVEIPVFTQPKFVHNPKDIDFDNINSFVTFDTETTGLGPLLNDIIQMSAVKMVKKVKKTPIKRRGKDTGKFKQEVIWERVDDLDLIIHTDKELEQWTTDLTGITNEQVHNSKISQLDAIKALLDFSKDVDVYVGQNITFDLNMIYGISHIKLDKPVFDTLTIARHVFPNKRSYNLTSLSKMTKVKLEKAHNALYDAEATGYVFVNLLTVFQNVYPDCKNVLDMSKLELTNEHAYQEVPFVKNIQLVAKDYQGLKELFAILSEANVKYYYRNARLPEDKFLQLYNLSEHLLLGNAGIDGLLLETLMLEGFEKALEHAKKFHYNFIALPNPEALGYPILERSEGIKNVLEKWEQLQNGMVNADNEEIVLKIEMEMKKTINQELNLADPIGDEIPQSAHATPINQNDLEKRVFGLDKYIHDKISWYKKSLKTNKDRYQIVYNNMKEIAKQLDLPFVIVSDLRKNDDAWLGAKVFSGLSQWNNAKFWTTKELIDMMSLFDTNENAHKVVVENTLLVRDMIKDDAHYVVKDLNAPHFKNAPEELRKIAYEKAHQLYGQELPQLIIDRMEKELKSIIESGFETVYLIASQLVKYTASQGAIAGSRGSVGSSFVAYLIGITEVNALPAHYRSKDGEYVEFPKFLLSGCDLPDKNDPRPGHENEKLIKDGHNLTYEIFAGINGDKVPDIDLNFDGESQIKAWNWIRNKFGKDKVFRVGTTSTNTLEGGLKKVKGYLKNHPQDKGVAEEYRTAQEGQFHYNTNGKHAGGVYIVPEDKNVFDFTPIQHPANDPNSNWLTTSLDKNTLHDSLLKMDVLGHEDELMLKVMYQRAGMTLDELKSIPLDDKMVIQFFDGEHNIGLPELGTDNISNIIRITQPKCFSDLVQIEGLAHSSTSWGDARPRIESGLVTIRDVIGTRDKVFNDLTSRGLSLQDANKFVDAIKKKKPFSDKMIKQLRNLKGLPDWYEESMLAQSYMYPGAHAVAYAMSAWRIAWFKAHMPLLFYRTWFEIRGYVSPKLADDMVTNNLETIKNHLQPIKNGKFLSFYYAESHYTARLVAEILERVQSASPNFQLFHDVDFNISKASEFVVKDNQIYLPFKTIEGVSDANAIFLEQYRNDNNGVLNEDLIAMAPKRRLPAKAQKAILNKMKLAKGGNN